MTQLKRWSVLLVLGAWLTGCTAGSQRPVESPWRCDPEGDAAVAAEDWQQGLVAHQQLLKSDPSNCLALFHLGYIWGQLNDRQKEIDFYGRAVTCGYDDDDRLFFNKGMALAALGQMDNALGAMERAVDLGPDNADNYFGLGMVAEKAGSPQRAILALQKAVALDPRHVDARVELIRLYLDHSRWQDASRQIKALEQIDPLNSELPMLQETLHRRRMDE